MATRRGDRPNRVGEDARTVSRPRARGDALDGGVRHPTVRHLFTLQRRRATVPHGRVLRYRRRTRVGCRRSLRRSGLPSDRGRRRANDHPILARSFGDDARLAAVLAAVPATETGTIATEADYENARISLYHATLPRLDHHGLRVSPEDGTVDDVSIPPAIYSCMDVETE
ncbi:hypothetical protein D8S78_14655 [Natrialba swarupiae]|nr:hypothetical protein [Natrialba swarupiae]